MKKDKFISKLKFLTNHSFQQNTGISGSFCVKRGVLRKEEPVYLETVSKKKTPAQFWPLAYWPDGSVKWIGVGFVVGKNHSKTVNFNVCKGQPARLSKRIKISKRKNTIYINTGKIRCRIPGIGQRCIDQLSILKNNRWITKVKEKDPVILYADKTTYKETKNTRTTLKKRFIGRTEKVSVEYSGSIRTVIKIEGTHVSGNETFLPYILRLYFYAGCSSIRMVHTFFYDGDAKKDFISGLGIQFPIQMKDKPFNRHVFMGSDDRLWHEPVNILPYILPLSKRGDAKVINKEYQQQYQNEYLSSGEGGEATPVWNNYTLSQDSSEHFEIRKAISDRFGEVTAMHGRRSSGWGGINAPQGGIVVGINDFWQSYPSGITISNAGRKEIPVLLSAEVWPKDAQPLDFRHYSDEAYGPNYETLGLKKNKILGFDKTELSPFAGNAFGIGRTSDLTFYLLDGSETEEIFTAQTDLTANPPVLVCPPKIYESAQVFSPWSLPSDKKQFLPLEKKLAELVDLCVKHVDEYKWYGFIDYGDFQICYDDIKKNWKYDEGGRAWINEELMPGIFLWQCFLRTGRLDVYRRAEAMSRHAEVDMFHLGPLRGIGTRHNVKHWGCGNHEIRQSMAGNKRYYHLISGDERTREIILDECQDVGKAWAYLVNKRKNRSINTNEVTGTLGPHLSSFFWNWLSVWEFTGSRKYRDIVINGIDYMVKQKQPYGLAGISMSYKINFETGNLELIPHSGKPPMANIFGSTEIWLELERILQSKTWTETLCKYGELHLIDTYDKRYKAAPESTGQGSGIEDKNLASGGNELIALAGAVKGDKKIILRGIKKLLKGKAWKETHNSFDNRRFSNWGRQAIALISLGKDVV